MEEVICTAGLTAVHRETRCYPILELVTTTFYKQTEVGKTAEHFAQKKIMFIGVVITGSLPCRERC